MTDGLVEQLRLPDGVITRVNNAEKAVNTDKIEGWFIRGPISGAWIGRVAHLSGDHTLHVALAIQYASGLQNNTKKIILERFHLDRLGAKKDSARRALERLRDAGLIKYTKIGQKYTVTVVPVPCEQE